MFPSLQWGWIFLFWFQTGYRLIWNIIEPIRDEVCLNLFFFTFSAIFCHQQQRRLLFLQRKMHSKTFLNIWGRSLEGLGDMIKVQLHAHKLHIICTQAAQATHNLHTTYTQAAHNLHTSYTQAAHKQHTSQAARFSPSHHTLHTALHTHSAMYCITPPLWSFSSPSAISGWKYDTAHANCVNQK